MRQAAITGASLGGLSAGGASLFMPAAFAADKPPIGTWPAGSSGNSVFVGLTVPRTGTYAIQGEDELKGAQLAIEHINAGHPLIKAISPKTTKGILGKEVKYGVADDEAKPNAGVQNISRFITENKAVVMMGGTSSAVAVALNKLAQREKVIHLAMVSGSNDTTGKDCVRYGFRECFYGQTAAAAIGPVLVKAFGKGKKAAYLTPDYTYGHTVQKSMSDYLNKEGGWTTVTNQVCPLGAPDYSLVPAQHRQLRRRHLPQHQLGSRRGAVDPAGQAVRRARQAEAGGSLPGAIPGARGRRRPDGRCLCLDQLLVEHRGQVSARQDVQRRSSRRSTATSRSGARSAPTCSSAMWANAVENAGSFYPPDVIKSYETGQKMQSMVGEVALPPRRSPAHPPRHHRSRQEGR